MKHNIELQSVLFLMLLIVSGLTSEPVRSEVVATLDPRATYLTAPSSDSPLLPIIIDLAAEGFSPGKVVQFSTAVPSPGYSFFDCNGPFSSLNTHGVFSTSDILLVQTAPHRVPDAIDVGFPPPSSLPEEFLWGQLPSTFTIAIPAGATHLFIGVGDSFFSDNCFAGNETENPSFPRGFATVTMRLDALIVSIDVKPGSDPNSINLCSNGTVPVAILGSDTVNVYEIVTATLRFAEAAVKVVGRKDPNELCSYEDVNSDGFTDLVCKYVTTDIAAINGESTSATINGELLDETPFEGADSVNIVKDTCN